MPDKAVSDLLTQIRDEQLQGRLTRCSMGVALMQLDPKDREAVQQALTDNSIFGTTIAKVLKARGYNVKPLAVNRHRRKQCACDT